MKYADLTYDGKTQVVLNFIESKYGHLARLEYEKCSMDRSCVGQMVIQPRLMSAFSWGRAPSGSKFWRYVNEELSKAIHIGNIMAYYVAQYQEEVEL